MLINMYTSYLLSLAYMARIAHVDTTPRMRDSPFTTFIHHLTCSQQTSQNTTNHRAAKRMTMHVTCPTSSTSCPAPLPFARPQVNS